MKRVLILGGTADALRIVSKIEGMDITYSLAGRTQNPNLPNCTVRSGGFGGADGLAAYLTENNIDSVIDATHPYAATMAANAAIACATTGISRAKYLRPEWQPEEGDKWISAADYLDAADILKDLGDRVFLSTGAQNLSEFAPLADKFFLLRAVQQPEQPIPLEIFSIILSRGPFERSHESMLFAKYDIQVLVSKNSGGEFAAKLLAARDRKTPVIMIERPTPPAGDIFHQEEDVIEWLARS